MDALIKIQSELKAPKNQRNKFGNYNYRSCEDILEALKPLLTANNALLTLNDEVIEVGGRIYVKATATIHSNGESKCSTGFAREEETKKGMDASQITGAASSYARKYALNALFLIDDTKDADSTNTHGKETKEPVNENEENNLAVWETSISKIGSINGLKKFWDDNKDSIGGDQKIISLFNKRKEALNG
jgi:hypothetical protein